MKCRDETWRPRSPAASTSVATTPARIAEGGAPATRMYTQIRASVVRIRVAAGTGKVRSEKLITAAVKPGCTLRVPSYCPNSPKLAERHVFLEVSGVWRVIG